MNLSELIAAVGDDNVGFQNLGQCADSLDWSTKKGTKITFVTDQPLAPDSEHPGSFRLPKLGLVVWLPRDAVAAALAKARNQ